MFPSNFGGAYIDSDGNAVVLVVETASAFMETVSLTEWRENVALNQLQVSDGAVVRNVAFSYNELWATVELLRSHFAGDVDAMMAANVQGWYVDVVGNRVVVELIYLSDEMVRLFRTIVLDSPIVEFEIASIHFSVDDSCVQELDYFPQMDDILFYEFGESSIAPFNSVVAAPGGTLFVYRGGVRIATASIGYRASLSGVRGFVTSAHLGSQISRAPLRAGDQVRVPGINGNIGHVASNNHVSLDNVDAVFVTLNSGFEISDTVMGGRIGASEVPNIWVGQQVYAIGYRTGFTRGQITHIGFNTHVIVNTTDGIERVPIRNALVSTHIGDRGDSGGIVYTWVGGGSFPHAVIGMHTASPSQEGVMSPSLVSVFHEINRIIRTTLR